MLSDYALRYMILAVEHHDLIVSDDMPQFKMASLLDIGVMKLIAASQRGAKKDFIDLYALEQHSVSIALLISLLVDKFSGSSINYYHIVKSLVFFEDAEMEPTQSRSVEMRMLSILASFM